MFRRIDLLLLGITVVLTLFGLAMIASVSVFESYQLTQRLTDLGQLGGPSNSFYLWRSFQHVVVGVAVLFLATITPYRFWEMHARTIFFLSIGLVIALFIPGLRGEWGTSNSWLRVGSFSLQPSELLKPAFIFYLSVWLQKREQLISTWKEGFVPFASLLVLSTFLVAIQPDLGSFLILSGIATVMFFIAGGNLFHLLLGGGMAGVFGLPLILQKTYIRNRFTAFISPADPSIAETIGFQIKQALIAIGSGGMFGVGYGKSIQKFGYLPEVQADMVFSAMAEELGFFRLLIVIMMYAILVYRGFQIAQHAPDRFGFLLATGITAWIAIQTLVNIAVNLALFPLTGLTLPFISYGGSSLVSLMGAIGILLNISMHSTEAIGEGRRTARHRSLLKSIV
jgi:cell division protein FtsW